MSNQNQVVTMVRLTTKHDDEVIIYNSYATAVAAMQQVMHDRLEAWPFDDQQRMLKELNFEAQLAMFNSLEAELSDGYLLTTAQCVVR